MKTLFATIFIIIFFASLADSLYGAINYDEIYDSVQKSLLGEGEILIHDARGYSSLTDVIPQEKQKSAEKSASKNAIIQLAQQLKRIVISDITVVQVREVIEQKFETQIINTLTPFAKEIAPAKFDQLEDGSLQATVAVRIPLNKYTVGAIMEVFKNIVNPTANWSSVVWTSIVVALILSGLIIYFFKSKKSAKIPTFVMRVSAFYIRKGYESPLWIGSSMDDDLYIEDELLREKYAKLSFVPGGFQLESGYGIDYSAKTESKIDLQTDGIQFKLGNTSLRYSSLDVGMISSIAEKSVKESVVIVDPWIARFEVVYENCQASRHRVLKENSIIHIGRLQSAQGYHIKPEDIILRERTSSRMHAKIYYSADDRCFFIENLSDKSAIIFYSDNRVIYKPDGPQVIKNGSIFQIGDTEFCITESELSQGQISTLAAKRYEFRSLIDTYYKLQEVIASDLQMLSFLSFDVVGSSQMKLVKELTDHLAIQYSFGEYHKFVREIVQNHHGQIHSTAGDGIMCRFDSAQEAVDTAIEVFGKLPDFNRSINRLNSPFVLRAGLETGEIVGGKELGIDQIFCRVVDLAGHIQKNALPGSFMISEQSYNQIVNKHDFEGPAGESDGQPIYRFKGR